MTPDEALDPGERRHRTRARAWFLQVHYRWEAANGAMTLREALAETREQRLVGAERLPYLRRLVDAFDAERDRIERAISSSLDNWRMERLAVMDRGILRMAATEILCLRDLPGKVAIQESVRLADRYGGHDSPRFVNGVLDGLYRADRGLPASTGPRRRQRGGARAGR